MEDVLKFKREAKEAREELEAAEEREKDRVKIIEGMKKKIKEHRQEQRPVAAIRKRRWMVAAGSLGTTATSLGTAARMG